MDSDYEYSDDKGHSISWFLNEAQVGIQVLYFSYRDDISKWVVLAVEIDESNVMERWMKC